MKKTIAAFIILTLCFSLFACGSQTVADTESEPSTTEAVEETIEETVEEIEPEFVTETDYMHIDGIYVDDSYVDEDGSPLKMVYVFYTLDSNENNLQIDSKYMQMTINGNTYESELYKDDAIACKYAQNYCYSGYIEDVYMGTSLKVVATFKVPDAGLASGNTITFSDTQIPDVSSIRLATDDIQRFASPEELAQAIDPDGYAAEVLAREDADTATVDIVKQSINGYYWSFYVNNTSYEIEFWDPNEFEVRTQFGTANGGTYEIKNGYIMCTYSGTGYTVEIPYEIVNGEADPDVVEAFDIN